MMAAEIHFEAGSCSRRDAVRIFIVRWLGGVILISGVSAYLRPQLASGPTWCQ